VALLEACASLGGMFALGMASLVISLGCNWRYAFWLGAGIALVGSVARTRLRETPEFADAKRRFKRTLEDAGKNTVG